jgi:hypothetical protein
MSTGDVTFAFTAGVSSVIAPFAESTGDGDGLGGQHALPPIVGETGPGVPADPHDAINSTRRRLDRRPTFTST